MIYGGYGDYYGSDGNYSSCGGYLVLMELALK
jgi:hypothetical protein